MKREESTLGRAGRGRTHVGSLQPPLPLPWGRFCTAELSFSQAALFLEQSLAVKPKPVWSGEAGQVEDQAAAGVGVVGVVTWYSLRGREEVLSQEGNFLVASPSRGTWYSELGLTGWTRGGQEVTSCRGARHWPGRSQTRWLQRPPWGPSLRRGASGCPHPGLQTPDPSALSLFTAG